MVPLSPQLNGYRAITVVDDSGIETRSNQDSISSTTGSLKPSHAEFGTLGMACGSHLTFHQNSRSQRVRSICCSQQSSSGTPLIEPLTTSTIQEYRIMSIKDINHLLSLRARSSFLQGNNFPEIVM
jgi:hypothetical protein